LAAGGLVADPQSLTVLMTPPFAGSIPVVVVAVP
jgi:hypothetical protein